jgi:hypothetical protein
MAKAKWSDRARELRFAAHLANAGLESPHASEDVLRKVADGFCHEHSDNVEALWIIANVSDNAQLFVAWKMIYGILTEADRIDIDALCLAAYEVDDSFLRPDADEDGNIVADDGSDYNEPEDYETQQARRDDADYAQGVADAREYQQNKKMFGNDAAERLEVQAEQRRYNEGED